MAASKTDWGGLALGIGAGMALGLVSAVAVVAVGVPTGWVAPLTGAIVGAFAPLIVRLRAKAEERRRKP